MEIFIIYIAVMLILATALSFVAKKKIIWEFDYFAAAGISILWPLAILITPFVIFVYLIYLLGKLLERIFDK